MKRTLAVWAMLLMLAGLVACGDEDDEGPPAPPVVTAEPSSGSEALSGKDLACKKEIVRQMEDPSQETQDVPPECQGISDDRLFELVELADAEAEEPGQP